MGDAYNQGNYVQDYSMGNRGGTVTDYSAGNYGNPMKDYSMGAILGKLINPVSQTNFDNQSMIKPNNTPYNYIDINALFPQLMQGGGSQGAASLLGDNAIGATQSASSGAGRFM